MPIRIPPDDDPNNMMPRKGETFEQYQYRQNKALGVKPPKPGHGYPTGHEHEYVSASPPRPRALPPFADPGEMYTLPPEAMGTQSRGNELDELLGPAPGGIQALGQNYAMPPKDAGRLDESTQRGVSPFGGPYRPDDLEIKPSVDRGRNIYRGSDIVIVHHRAHVI